MCNTVVIGLLLVVAENRIKRQIPSAFFFEGLINEQTYPFRNADVAMFSNGLSAAQRCDGELHADCFGELFGMFGHVRRLSEQVV